MTTLIHRTNAAPFAAFDLTRARSADEMVVWFGLERDSDELAFFGENICRAEVDLAAAGTVDYTDFAEDGDPMYDPATMAVALASSTAAAVRIRKVTMTEHGRPTTVYAVRDTSLISIVAWEIPADEDEDEDA